MFEETIAYLKAIRSGLHMDHPNCALSQEMREKANKDRELVNFAISCIESCKTQSTIIESDEKSDEQL